MKLSQRERVLAFAAIAVVIASLLYASALEPALVKWRRGNALLEERRGHIAKLEKELQKETTVEKKYAAAMRRVERESRNPLDAQKLFSFAQSVAARTGVRVKGVDPLPPARHENRDEIAIRVDLSSELPQLAEFLYVLQEKSGRINISRVSVAPLEPGNPALSSQVRISASVYRPEAVEQ